MDKLSNNPFLILLTLIYLGIEYFSNTFHNPKSKRLSLLKEIFLKAKKEAYLNRTI